MPAIQACIIEPIWDQFCDVLPDRPVDHPLGCHRPRIPDRLVFDKLVQVLVIARAYARIADATCSATTLRRRRDEWINAGIMDRLEAMVLDAYDRMIGLELGDIAVDGCITKALCGGECAGRSPVDRGKQGLKRSTVVDAHGIPLGAVAAPANRHDSPLREPTLDTLDRLGPLPDPMTAHLDRGYDSTVTRERLAARGLHGEIAWKGKPAPIAASSRWPVERTNAWTNAHKKLVWCTERRACVVAFWLAFSAVIIIVRRLMRQAGPSTAGRAARRDDHERPLLAQPLNRPYWRSLLIAHTGAYSDARPWSDAIIAGIDINRHALAELLRDHLPFVRYCPPQNTYLDWTDCSELGLGDDPAKAFRERGRVALSSGKAFGEGGAGHVRLDLATSPEILTEAVTWMASVQAGSDNV